MTARPPAPGEQGTRGDPAPRGDSPEGLLSDLGLVVSDAIRRRAGLREQDPAALDRLTFSLGWSYPQSAAEITGRLAVALARAQARGAQDSGRPEDPGEVITVSALTGLAARLIRDTYPDSVHGEGICREAFANLLATASGQEEANVRQVLDRLAPGHL